MKESSSVTSFVMGERLPWSEDAPAGEPTGPLEHGVLFASGQRRPCAIRKISCLGVTVRGAIAQGPGEEVAVELIGGQRPSGTVDWVVGGEAGIRFKQPIDVLALINRKLVSQPAERRTMPRVELRCPAQLKWCGRLSAATVRNISARGLQVEGDDLPPRETYISVLLDGLLVPAGEVVWSKGSLAGVELFEELAWTSLMPWIRRLYQRPA